LSKAWKRKVKDRKRRGKSLKRLVKGRKKIERKGLFLIFQKLGKGRPKTENKEV